MTVWVWCGLVVSSPGTRVRPPWLMDSRGHMTAKEDLCSGGRGGSKKASPSVGCFADVFSSNNHPSEAARFGGHVLLTRPCVSVRAAPGALGGDRNVNGRPSLPLSLTRRRSRRCIYPACTDGCHVSSWASSPPGCPRCASRWFPGGQPQCGGLGLFEFM